MLAAHTASRSTQTAAAPILLFSHFFGSTHREWALVMERLADRYRCIAADAPGFGDSRDVPGYTVQKMATHFRELIEQYAPQPLIFVGHSFTGKVAMVLGAQPPANLIGLVLVAPSPLVAEPMEEEARAAMKNAQQSRATAESFFRKGARRPLTEEQVIIGIEDVLAAHPDAWHAWPQSGSREDWSMSVRQIALPSLLVVGGLDPAIPLEFQRRHTLPLLAEGRLEVISGAGHLLPYEAPEELANLIKDVTDTVAAIDKQPFS